MTRRHEKSPYEKSPNKKDLTKKSPNLEDNLHGRENIHARLVIADNDVGLLLVDVFCAPDAVGDAQDLVGGLHQVGR